MLKDSLYKDIINFFRFGMVGICNTLISLAVYYLVIYFNSAWYLFGHILGFLVSTLNAYIMNSKFVFKVKKFDKKHLIKTYCTYIASLCISTFLLYVLVDILDIDSRVAPIFSLMITVPFNYLVSKFWVYVKG